MMCENHSIPREVPAGLDGGQRVTRKASCAVESALGLHVAGGRREPETEVCGGETSLFDRLGPRDPEYRSSCGTREGP